MSITGKDSALTSVLGRVKGTLTSALGGISRIAGLLGGVGGIAGLGFAVKLAADAEETQSKFEAVFKSLTAEAETFAKEFAGSVGRSVNETKRQLAEFQDLFVPLGFARKNAADLSKQLVTLTADMASFSNKADVDVQRDLQSALVGNTETVRKYGIIITQASLNQELINQGFAKGVKGATEQQKVQARLNIIIRDTGDAQGDALKTAGSFTNRMKALMGILKDTGAVIGSAFLPALAKMAEKATEALRGVLPAIKDWASNFAKWGKVIVDNWMVTWDLIKQTVVVGFEFVKQTIGQLPKFFGFAFAKILRLTFDLVVKIGEMFVTLIQELPTILANAFRGVEDPVVGALKGIIAGFKNQDFADIFEPGPELKAALKKQSDLIDKLKTARRGLDKEAAEPLKLEVDTGTQKIEKAIVSRMELPKGFLGFADLQRKLQESLLKGDDPQKKMLGLLDQDKVQQQNQASLLEKIAENTGITSGTQLATT